MATSRRNRYGRSLNGLNAIGFFSPVTAYTAATTYTEFVSLSALAANNGKMAIINDTTKAVLTSALTSGTRFFIAQVVDGDIKKSPVMTFSTGTVIRKTVYNAPVLQETRVGYNGSTGTLGVAAPAAGQTNTYTISARDTSPASQPFPIQEGTAVVKSTTATIYDITASLVSDFLNVPDYEKSSDINFVNAEIITNGTATAIATVTATVIQGSATVTYSGAHTLVVGDLLEFTATGKTYKVVQVISSTVAVLDRPYAGTSFTTAAGGTAKKTVVTATGIAFTAFVEDTNFVLSKNSSLSGALVTFTTPWKQGSGAAWQASLMEEETHVFSGFTTGNYPFVQDMGKPTSFVLNPETSAVQYTMYFIKYTNTTDSMAYFNQPTSAFGYLIMGIPNSGGPQATIDTVLGV